MEQGTKPAPLTCPSGHTMICIGKTGFYNIYECKLCKGFDSGTFLRLVPVEDREEKKD